MYTREELNPKGFGKYEVNVIDHQINLKDGTVLSVKSWFPRPKENFGPLLTSTKYCEPNPSSEQDETKFPAVLEYLAYCKSTWTRERDHLRHPWLASHGYVVLRPDMRGSGDSGGVYYDEYLKQEQDDCCEVIDWISKQSWSNGSVGMFGKSWGGFNGLQVAFEQPPALKAVISLYSTDNRYYKRFDFKYRAPQLRIFA